jgi:CrcB protein
LPEAGRRNGVDHRSSVAPVTVRHRAWIVVAVALGGALGTVARYGLALAEPVQSGRFPWATFIANMVGSLVLGIVVVALAETCGSRGVLRSFAAVGVCGGLTTFSTWMVESMLLIRDGSGGTAALYLFTSLVAGFAGVAAGMVGTRRALGRPVPAYDPKLDD